MRWSAALHYIGAIDDYPPNDCAYPGSNGWAGRKEINVLDGIKNVTGLLEYWVKNDTSDDAASEALKFLVHFLGDMHQPLHLTGRDRGGNSAKVVWDGRQTSKFFILFFLAVPSWRQLIFCFLDLHSLWDGLLIAKAVRTVPPNYSLPLPYPDIEGALRGAIYDSYIRRILWEGTLNKWADEIDGWLSCAAPTPDFETASTWQKVLSGLSGFNTRFNRQGVEINPDGDVVCPYFWSQSLSALNCDIVWPKELTLMESEENEPSLETAALELDTPGYAGVIEKRMLLEKLLAQGGVRLAGLLNYLFADQGTAKGLFVMNLKA